jgi:drug/metabolite transporter (DMT)-like permease
MSRMQANFVLLFAALIWGLGNVAQKTVLDDIGPLTATALRGCLGALIVLPWAVREWRRTAPFRAADRRLAFSVAGYFALALTLSQIGFGGTSVTNASFLLNTTTVVTPLLVWLIYRRVPRQLLWPAIALTLTGIWLLGGGSLAKIRWGDGLCLLSAAAYSIWLVQIGELVQRTGRPTSVAAIQFAAAGLVAGVLGLSTEPQTVTGLVGAAPELMLLGVFSTGIAFLIAAIAQQYTSPTEAAILMSAEGLFGALGGALLLGERMDAGMALGAVLIIAGILVVQLPENRPFYRLVSAIDWATGWRLRHAIHTAAGVFAVLVFTYQSASYAVAPAQIVRFAGAGLQSTRATTSAHLDVLPINTIMTSVSSQRRVQCSLEDHWAGAPWTPKTHDLAKEFAGWSRCGTSMPIRHLSLTCLDRHQNGSTLPRTIEIAAGNGHAEQLIWTRLDQPLNSAIGLNGGRLLR